MRPHTRHLAFVLCCIVAAAYSVALLHAADKDLSPSETLQMIWPVDDPPGQQVRIVGQYPAGRFGDTLAAGDVNGDGYQDLIVGARSAGSLTFGGGEVYVLLGPFPLDGTTTTQQAGALIIQGDGPGLPQIGFNLDSGDLNGDGYDDVVAGSRYYTYVYLGSAGITSTFPLTVSATAENMALTVLAGDQGFATCDLNGDGYDDLFVETVGKVWGILGRPSFTITQPITIDPRSDPVDIKIAGFEPEGPYYPGSGSLGCGDVDGDGHLDLVVGAPGESPGEGRTAGRVYVIRGSTQFTTGLPITLTVPDQAGAIIEGVDGGFGRDGDMLGLRLAVADVNADGRADLILVAPQGDGPGNLIEGLGDIYLWPGRDLRGQRVSVGATSEWRIYGAETYNHLGMAIAAADFDGDTRPDLLIGCQNCEVQDAPEFNAGTGYLIDVGALQGDHVVTEVARFEIHGSVESAGLGTSVGAIRLDANGRDSIVISSPWETFPPLTPTPDDQAAPGTVFVIPYPFHRRSFLPVVFKR